MVNAKILNNYSVIYTQKDPYIEPIVTFVYRFCPGSTKKLRTFAVLGADAIWPSGQVPTKNTHLVVTATLDRLD
jgi:hypothetical protein